MARAVKIKSPSQRSRDEARRQDQRSRRRRHQMMLAAIAAAAVVGVLVVVGAISRGGNAGPTASSIANAVSGKTLGSANAPVTITVWEDFQCPFCKQVNSGALAQVITDYVNAGKAKVVYKQFPFLGKGGANDESMLAAQASECAVEQQKFWPYHDALFAAQSGENRGAFSTANLKNIARDTGLDQDAFASCLSSGKFKSAIEQEKASGDALGITSTPTVFINGQKLVGVQPYGVFKDAIDKALQAAR